MKAMFKIAALASLLIVSALVATGCGEADADVASHNLSEAADNFEIERRVVFFNGITDKYLLVIEGRCALGNKDTAKKLSVTCKVGKDAYKKHFLGLSDNVSYFVEQTKAESVSTYRYRVTYKPSTIIPDIDMRLGGKGDAAKQETDTPDGSASDAAIADEATRDAKGDAASEAARDAVNGDNPVDSDEEVEDAATE